MREPAHPCVHVLGTIDLAGFFNLGIRRKCLFDQAADLLFIGRMPFDRLHNQTMRRSSGLLGEGSKTRP